MSIESALRELGKEIQKDERFTALQKAAAANDADEKLQQQMQEMQLISLKYQQEAQKGEEASQERIAELQKDYEKLYGEIMEGENMQKYSAAAAEMEELAKYISGMIGLFFDGQDAATCELPKEDGCTHDCCTCGGCH
ncbi:MAG: YlbF family regulator [Acetobacter sp.]|nr:YlbF family regulator [Bacteroides sp.]MCM1340234.1 YlbF family regulator [Acetobacter sp.]MCM1432814.1 YlbF family regulator [Clostridiales bacterium]